MPNSSKSKLGIDVLGFGPIGRKLAEIIVTDSELKRIFAIRSIADSSGSILLSGSSSVLDVIKWKEAGKKISNLKGKSLESLNDSDSKITVDVTNSDYMKPSEARKRAESALNSGRHFVSASKVALSFFFPEIIGLAKKKGLEVGYGATVCGGRNAITVAREIGSDEIKSASAVLNASTTLILSSLEENHSLSFGQACERAASAGVLESDWAIDLDGIDAAAKSAILSNALFPKSKVSFKNVERSGIRDERSKDLIARARKGGNERVRLVSRLSTDGLVTVAAELVARTSVLSVEGRFNAVSLETKSLGEISVRNLGGGTELTCSVIISDLKKIACREG
ncbi:MAG: hypothetical protein ACYC7D_06185 [Nitrososphaerales archaeon]